MAATTALPEEQVTERRDAFAEKIGESLVGGLEIGACYIGHRLGYYRALADAGQLTAPELARRTGTHGRYAREWLEQQTVAGILSALNIESETDERLFSIPPGHDEVLLDIDSLTYMPGAMRMFVAMLNQAPNVVEAFRTGGGIPYDRYGSDMVEGIDEENRAGARQLLGKKWIPEMPDIHRRLLSAPPARVADIGCGAGRSAIALALDFPDIRIDGFDIDAASIDLGTQRAQEAGVADRVQLYLQDAGAIDAEGAYDLVMSFVTIHDLPQPVPVLKAMRRMVADGGGVILTDPAFGPFAGEVGTTHQRFFYGASVLHCLPVGMSEQPSVGSGAALQVETMRSYAREAGFRDIELVPVTDEGAANGLYRLLL